MKRGAVDDDTERVEVGDNWGKGRGSLGAQVSTSSTTAEAWLHSIDEDRCLDHAAIEVVGRPPEANARFTEGLSSTSTFGNIYGLGHNNAILFMGRYEDDRGGLMAGTIGTWDDEREMRRNLAGGGKS